MSIETKEMEDKIRKLKERYDRSRTMYEVSKRQRDEINAEFKKMGIDPNKVEEYLEKLNNTISKETKEITSLLSNIDKAIKNAEIS